MNQFTVPPNSAMVQIRNAKATKGSRGGERPAVPLNLVIVCLFMISGLFLSLFLSSAFGWFAEMASFVQSGPPIHLSMPKIGLGTLMLGRKDVRSTILMALELGYRRIDCAPVYFNEDVIGDVLYEQKIVNREELFIVSKLAAPYHKQQHVEKALQKTLTDLRLDYLDLYLVHWPVAFKYVPIYSSHRGWANEDIDDSADGKNIDPSVSLLETWRGMEDLVKKGLVKHIGLSNVPVALLRELLANELRIPPAINQVELHPFLPQANLVRFCLQNGIQVQAYAPLGSPEYKASGEPAVLDELKDVSSGTPAQVAIAWALQRGTTVTVKSISEAHLKDNINAEHIKLKSTDIAKINKLDRNYRFFRPEDWWGPAGAIFD